MSEESNRKQQGMPMPKVGDSVPPGTETPEGTHLEGASLDTATVVPDEIEQQKAALSKGTDAIEVEALRPGFYANQRKGAGSKFMVTGATINGEKKSAIDMIGTWMSPTDEKLKKQHQDKLRKQREERKEQRQKIKEMRKARGLF